MTNAPHGHHTDERHGCLFAGGSFGVLDGDALRRVRDVGKRAALAGKRKIWDTNDASVLAAQSAVDAYESSYLALRSILIATFRSVSSAYSTVKSAASGIEHHLLVPVRDAVLLPAFAGAERGAAAAAGFVGSDEARALARGAAELVRGTPFVGETVLGPCMGAGVDVLGTVWEVAKYPIPSRNAVRTTVDGALTVTKFAIRNTAREIFYYMNTVDATITRAMLHTQWRILGSGPYSSLSPTHKSEVQDHISERYFALSDRHPVARYEFAAHIKSRNRALYDDLVSSGLLLRRARGRRNDGTAKEGEEDEWLVVEEVPRYRTREAPLLLPPGGGAAAAVVGRRDSSGSERERRAGDGDATATATATAAVRPVWFHLPFVNGNRPGKDSPWARFRPEDQPKLERAYVVACLAPPEESSSSMSPSDRRQDVFSSSRESSFSSDVFDDALEVHQEQRSFVEGADVFDCNSRLNPEVFLPPPAPADLYGRRRSWDRTQERERRQEGRQEERQYPTVAEWYEPDATDVLVDQCRHSVSLAPRCVFCGVPRDPDEDRRPHLDSPRPQPRPRPRRYAGYVCDVCESSPDSSSPSGRRGAATMPRVDITMRPTLWRYYGSRTHDVRRGTWLLETHRHGLQPYCDDSSAVLEDAYMFLKYYRRSRSASSSSSSSSSSSGSRTGKMAEEEEEEEGGGIEDVLLSVEVRGPDGDEQQLVQFRSLSNVTAIQKTLGGAVALFKRRVYRGVCVAAAAAAASSHSRGASGTGPTAEDDVANEGEASFGMVVVAGGGSRRDETEETDGFVSADAVDGGDAGSYRGSPSASLAAPLDQNLAQDEDTFADDNVEHLVLVVHGIGEMLRSADLFGLGLPALSSIVDCCAWLRNNHSEVHAAQFANFHEMNSGSSFTREEIARSIMGRVEYLPVEWHEAFALQTRRRRDTPFGRGRRGGGDGGGEGSAEAATLNDISLKTIPALRDFANNTLLDVLYFMSPPHHEVIVGIVTRELHQVVGRYRNLTGFRGKISILGHSLGSIIGWDILSHQSTAEDLTAALLPPQSPGIRSPGRRAVSPSAGAELSSAAVGPRRPEEYPQLDFHVSNFFMVGSPVAVFLMIRDQHEPLGDGFSLPGCPRVFNIFHPYDPAAYRIEPLISARNSDVDAKIIAHWKSGGLRVKYQTKFMLKKLWDETKRTQQTVADAVEAGIAGMGLLDAGEEDDDVMNKGSGDDGTSSSSDESDFVDCGSLNQGRRVDFMLQEKEIENANEYVFALAAHSSYWNEKDLSSFLARQILRSRDDDDDDDAAVGWVWSFR